MRSATVTVHAEDGREPMIHSISAFEEVTMSGDFIYFKDESDRAVAIFSSRTLISAIINNDEQ